MSKSTTTSIYFCSLNFITSSPHKNTSVCSNETCLDLCQIERQISETFRFVQENNPKLIQSEILK